MPAGRPGYADSIKKSIDREMNRRVSRAYQAGLKKEREEHSLEVDKLIEVVIKQAAIIIAHERVLSAVRDGVGTLVRRRAN